MASTYVDISLGLSTSKGLITNEEVVIQRLQLLLTTEPGDMLDLPNFGIPLRQFLYEPMTDSLKISIVAVIKHAVSTWMGTQVRIDMVDIKDNKETSEIFIAMGIYLLEFDKSGTVVETFKK